jgi:hypothetical protein
MLDQNALTELAREIKALGYDEKTASYYAAQIGDTPGFDEHGNLVVSDERGIVIATLPPLKFFPGIQRKTYEKRRN